MKSARQYVRDALLRVFEKLGGPDSLRKRVSVSPPRDSRWGDYSTNAAFVIAEGQGRAAPDVARDIIESFDKEQFEKVDVEAGFLNFTLSRGYIHSFVEQARTAGLHYGENDSGVGKSMLIEFVSANPTGPLVVANARAAAIGDSLVRISRHCGYKTRSEFYVDDAGRQIELLGLSVEARLRELSGEEAEIPTDGYTGEYVRDIAEELAGESKVLLSLPSSDRLEKLKSHALKRMLSSQKRSLESFDVLFDNWAHESAYRGEEGTGRLLRALGEKGDTYEQEGALWFRSSKYGDERDRVLRKSDGELTYLVADSAYHKDKFERGFDRILDLFGPDHLAQVPSLRAVLKASGHDGDRLEVLIVQWVTLISGGKKLSMSKRGGTFVTMDELVEEVGRDAARFFFLMRKPSSHLDFDIDLAKRTSDENPVYYVQYAHARICSILEYAKEKGLSAQAGEDADLSLLVEPEERDLMIRIAAFCDTVADCMADLSPHRIPFFLQDLASSFHNFYHKHRVVAEDLPLSRTRIALCEAVRNTIATGLALIGVSAPLKM
jgi:arginyl-tRNA synthetase